MLDLPSPKFDQRTTKASQDLMLKLLKPKVDITLSKSSYDTINVLDFEEHSLPFHNSHNPGVYFSKC